MHYGFTPGAADAIYMLRLFTKKNRFKNKVSVCVFWAGKNFWPDPKGSNLLCIEKGLSEYLVTGKVSFTEGQWASTHAQIFKNSPFCQIFPYFCPLHKKAESPFPSFPLPFMSLPWSWKIYWENGISNSF